MVSLYANNGISFYVSLNKGNIEFGSAEKEAEIEKAEEKVVEEKTEKEEKEEKPKKRTTRTNRFRSN